MSKKLLVKLNHYSRGYRALCVFPKKHSYFVVLTILRAFRLHSKPELFHHDNSGEYDNGVVSRLLQMRDIVDVPTEVENPKGKGKKDCEAVLINLFLKGWNE